MDDKTVRFNFPISQSGANSSPGIVQPNLISKNPYIQFMIERFFRGFIAVVKGDLLLCIVMLVLSGIAYIVSNLR
jgi:hypothetical protein